VASSTNRTTLIAAIVPAGAVTLHTIFCCRMHLPGEQAFALCALMNSYVANYLVRRWVTTHVTAGVIARVPVPFPDDRMRERLARLARALARRPHPRIEARVQAAAGVAYELTRGEFEHVIATFPLVDRSARQAALEAFSDGARS
jgi:hypothetical protein